VRESSEKVQGMVEKREKRCIKKNAGETLSLQKRDVIDMHGNKIRLFSVGVKLCRMVENIPLKTLALEASATTFVSAKALRKLSFRRPTEQRTRLGVHFLLAQLSCRKEHMPSVCNAVEQNSLDLSDHHVSIHVTGAECAGKAR
jgi:hypothetical protein